MSALRRVVAAVVSAGSLVVALLPAPALAEVVVVLNSGDASVTLIDRDTQKVLETFPVGKEPHHLIATPDNKSLIVANAVGNDLVLLDPVAGKVQQRVADIDDPYQIGFSPDQKWFVVTGNRLDRVDLYRWDGKALKMARQLPLAKTPSHVAFTDDSRIAFVTLQDSNEVVAIDLPTQTVMWRMEAGSAPAGIWVTPDQKYLLVGMTGADYVAVIDWRARTVVKQIQTGKGAHNFRALGDRRHLFLSNRVSGTISIIDQQSLSKVGDITGLLPGPDDMELSADGKTLWVTFRWARAVGVIDVPSRKLMKTIKVGKSPHGIYFRTRAPLY
ncbi:beta-propeller fold lactonase family protein [Cupriavidus respiraculi]|uniref:YVTN family beta-propeller repeat protein n=1 Tax=Cupriavidus respiraculi TaxID=195930 RepID=UPI001C96B309|nr:cytochrome D1 domain-containing protein [Cupriavidus respiraculi]MBY4946842.1 beta-propeller fold lactonase family protein [Cupriavidus respiraculi]